MADSVVKLRIDSKEFDANIKRAGQELTDYFAKVRAGGGTLMELDEGVMECVKAMGELGTQSSNTRGGLREMTQAITDLTAQYRQFTDEENNSPMGQELAKSLRQMTERAGNMRDAMADVSASITNAASDTRRFDQATQGISLVTSGFQTLQGAAKLLGVEMGDNVEVIAKLQAAMAVTNGLTQAQTALQKQSALMQGVMAVQAKAAALAVELEGNATKGATVAQAAFNAVAKANPYVLLASAVAAVGTALFAFSGKADKATDAIKTNTDAMSVANRMADIWKNTMGGTFSSLMTKYDELKRQWEALKDSHSKTEWIKQNQNALHDLGGAVTDVKSAEDFFNNNTDAVVQSFVRRAQAAARVAQLTELYRKQIELLDKKSQTSATIASDAQSMGRSAKAGDEITDASFRNSRYGSVNQAGKWVFSDQGAKLYSGTDTSSSQAVMKIDVELQANQAEIDKVKGQITNEFSDITVGGGSGGKGGTTTDPAIKIQQQFDTAMLKSAAGTASLKPEDVFGPSDAWKAYTEDIRNGLQGVGDEMSNLTTWTKDFDPYKQKMQELATAAKQQQKAYAMAASAVQNLGSAFASIEDPAAKAAGTVIQAIASIALGFAQASVQAAGMGPWGWVAFLAAGAAAMATTISTVHSLTGYANGGVVKGSSYSGDNIPALVDGSELVGLNAGEIVLNAAQQSNVAQSLQQRSGNTNVSGVLRGEDIFIAADRYARRSGKGEILTWK